MKHSIKLSVVHRDVKWFSLVQDLKRVLKTGNAIAGVSMCRYVVIQPLHDIAMEVLLLQAVTAMQISILACK